MIGNTGVPLPQPLLTPRRRLKARPWLRRVPPDDRWRLIAILGCLLAGSIFFNGWLATLPAMVGIGILIYAFL